MLLWGRTRVLTTVPLLQGVILELLKEAMVASLGHTAGFLVDGYPQEVKQGKEFGRRVSGVMGSVPEEARGISWRLGDKFSPFTNYMNQHFLLQMAETQHKVAKKKERKKGKGY